MIYHQVPVFWTLAQICCPPGNDTDSLTGFEKISMNASETRIIFEGGKEKGDPMLRAEPPAAPGLR